MDESYYHSFHSNGDGGGSTLKETSSHFNGADGDASGTVFDFRGMECGNEESRGSGSVESHRTETGDLNPLSSASDNVDETPLVPMTLYLHRVKGLVLALLVKPHFLSDTASMEEVVRNNLSSLYYIERNQKIKIKFEYMTML